MSFYSMAHRDNMNCPGPFSSQEVQCIKEKVCIQVKKVYDACLQQDLLEDKEVTIWVHGSFTEPLTFVSCRSKTSSGIVKNLRVDRLEDRPNLARVRAKVIIPLLVEFIDKDGKRGTGKGFICIDKDVILYVPDESVIPFEIEATVGATCADGEFQGGGRSCSEGEDETVEETHAHDKCGRHFTFELDICYTIILKVVAEVELLIPAFGFCFIPPCEEFAENICEEFFNLPLFPPQLKKLHRMEE